MDPILAVLAEKQVEISDLTSMLGDNNLLLSELDEAIVVSMKQEERLLAQIQALQLTMKKQQRNTITLKSKVVGIVAENKALESNRGEVQSFLDKYSALIPNPINMDNEISDISSDTSVNTSSSSMSSNTSKSLASKWRSGPQVDNKTPCKCGGFWTGNNLSHHINKNKKIHEEYELENPDSF